MVKNLVNYNLQILEHKNHQQNISPVNNQRSSQESGKEI